MTICILSILSMLGILGLWGLNYAVEQWQERRADAACRRELDRQRR